MSNRKVSRLILVALMACVVAPSAQAQSRYTPGSTVVCREGDPNMSSECRMELRRRSERLARATTGRRAVPARSADSASAAVGTGDPVPTRPRARAAATEGDCERIYTFDSSLRSARERGGEDAVSSLFSGAAPETESIRAVLGDRFRSARSLAARRRQLAAAVARCNSGSIGAAGSEGGSGGSEASHVGFGGGLAH